MKRFAQAVLKRLQLYERVKSSFCYELYWSVIDKHVIESRAREVKFCRETLDGLQSGDLIFDIGANRGWKTGIFLRLGARVLAVEPDVSNQQAIEASYLRYRFRQKPVIIVGKAVSDSVGVNTMWIDEPGSAENTMSVKWVNTLKTDPLRLRRNFEFKHQRDVETTTLEQLIQLYGRPFYIKIDVEGYEPQVLRGIQSIVPYISFEVNLPEFRPEAEDCIAILESLAAGGRFNYAASPVTQLFSREWFEAKPFMNMLNSCAQSCIEVFWRAPIASSKSNRWG